MEKFLKRPREDGVEAESPSRTKAAKKTDPPCVLVVLPGAGGSLAKNMSELVLDKLQTRGFMIRRSPLKWNTFAAGHKDNVSAVLGLIPSDVDFYIMGNSFGNRVICEMMSKKLLPVRCKGAILCGFPLYGDKNKNDRLVQLQAVPKDSTLMLISGTNDEFLNRDFLHHKGETLLRSVVKDMHLTGRNELHFIEGGKHDVPTTGSKKTLLDSATKVINHIINFCI
jgi:predicted alpha/beta-hydrolase family hydrolase